jgi:ATP-binding cassette subfamily F protein 3
MIALRLDNITFSHPDGLTLEKLSLAVQADERMGLVGANGSGKSTILKIMADKLNAESGYVVKAKGVSVGYLPQDITLNPQKTVLSEALNASSHIAELEEALHAIEAALADPDIYNDEKALTQTLEEQARLLEAYEEAGGLSYEKTVKATLRKLGFTDDDFNLSTHALSGGQKKMLALAKLVVNNPAVLLLDEPDNHLDLAGKHLLEQFIHRYDGAVIIVSHDRYLLDEVATHIAELENGRLTLYPGNYTAYANERELRRLRQQQLYMAQQKEIARIEAAIARFEKWAAMVVDERHIRQSRHRQKMLDRMDNVEKVKDLLVRTIQNL